jgi:hypothetical protein
MFLLKVNPYQVPGRVTVLGPVTRTVHVDATGWYRFRLPPGTYQITGTSPRFANGQRKCVNSPSKTGRHPPVVVRAGSVGLDDLGCVVRTAADVT